MRKLFVALSALFALAACSSSAVAMSHWDYLVQHYHGIAKPSLKSSPMYRRALRHSQSRPAVLHGTSYSFQKPGKRMRR